MSAATSVANERAFEVDSERESPAAVILIIALAFSTLAFFDCIRESFQRPQSCIHGRGDGSRKVSCDSMARKEVFDRGQSVGGIVHDVISGAAVNVEIDVTGRDDGVAEIE